MTITGSFTVLVLVNQQQNQLMYEGDLISSWFGTYFMVTVTTWYMVVCMQYASYNYNVSQISLSPTSCILVNKWTFENGTFEGNN